MFNMVHKIYLSSLQKKTQISVEFILMISFILFMFIILLVVFSNKMNEAVKENNQLQAQNVKEQLYGELYNALKAMNGYNRSFNMSATADLKPFRLSLEDEEMLVINYTDNLYVYPLPANVTGNINAKSIGGNYVYIFTILKNKGNVTLFTECGNKKIQGIEQCDDGDSDNFDACLNNCLINVPTDGYLNVGVEGCDDGNVVDTDCCSNLGVIKVGCVCTGMHPSICS
jgi:cysteine-rich repeat protein